MCGGFIFSDSTYVFHWCWVGFSGLPYTLISIGMNIFPPFSISSVQFPPFVLQFFLAIFGSLLLHHLKYTSTFVTIFDGYHPNDQQATNLALGILTPGTYTHWIYDYTHQKILLFR
jgi:hypothetical protein